MRGEPERARDEAATAARPSLAWTVYTWTHVLSFLVVGAATAVLVGGAAALLGDRQRHVAHACLSLAFRAIVRLHPRYRLDIVGLERLPKGPAVWCPNHQSLSDIVYLSTLPGAFKWVVKRELFRVPMFGVAMRVAGYPAIERGDLRSAQNLLTRVRALLGAGVSVVSFPEGTRSADGQLGVFLAGPARMAIDGGVPLVPIGIAGTERLLPRGRASYPASATIAIVIGAPIVTAGSSPRQARVLTRALRDAVASARDAAQARADRSERG